MSRLDDELRKAFRREQPPADFTARLLERVARQPEPRTRWWQRLATLLDPPKLRWVAIGVTASLLLAIGAAQYRRLNQAVVTDNGKVATTVAPPEEGSKTPESAATTGKGKAEPKSVSFDAISKPSRRGSRQGNQRLAPPAARQERELRAEGEAAKETLMLALSIASSALSDVQKAVQDDGLKP
jgi:hypothetical protein